MNTVSRLGTLVLTICLASGCQEADKKKVSNDKAVCPVGGKSKSGNAACPVPAAGAADQSLPGQIEGTVVQTLAAGRYVYAEVDTGAGTVWVAAPEEPVAKGDKVICKPQTVMEKFESPTLKRTFDKIYFVGALKNPSVAAGMPTNHQAMGSMPAGHGSMPSGHTSKQTAGATDIKVNVAKVDGGVTIAEIVAQLEKLAGTEVLLRAKVIKFNPNILGANWLRVKDSSEERDLAITTKVDVKPGDTVLIRGRLERDIDIGSGYKYDIIIRNAEVTVEKP